MQNANADFRVGGVAGVLGVVILLVGLFIFPIWDFPGTAATGSQIESFASRHGAALQVTMLLYSLGVTLWLVFGAALWADMRSRVARESIAPACFAAGLVGFVTLLLAGFVAFDIIVYRRPSASESKMLYDLTFGLLAMSGLPTAVSLGAFAASNLRHRFRPRYTTELAGLAMVGHVLLLLSFIVRTGFFSLEGVVITAVPAVLFAWILATGMSMANTKVPG